MKRLHLRTRMAAFILFSAMFLLTLSTLSAQLGTATASPANQLNLSPEKQEIEARLEQFRRDGEARRAPKDSDYVPTESSASACPPPRGILENKQGPFSSMVFQVENKWQEFINGHQVNVFAGSMPQDPEQGAVLVTEWCEPGAHTLPTGFFRTPTKSGALRIVAAGGMRLDLAAKDGTSFKFDVGTGAFVP